MLLSWYRTQSKEHGFVSATRLLASVVFARGTTMVVNRLLPPRVVCPCCQWEGRRFYHYMEVGLKSANTECPRCNSHPRHRALYLWLQDKIQLLSERKVALIFAPERALNPLWRQARSLSIFKVDIEDARGVDVLADVQRLPFKSDSVDFIWCHHVLQMIEDDRAAIGELCRVLRPETGELVVSVAIAPSPVTREFGFADKDLLYFWRMYGDDFSERLTTAGLTARLESPKLSAEEYRRYAVSPQESFYLCAKKLTPDPSLPSGSRDMIACGPLENFSRTV